MKRSHHKLLKTAALLAAAGFCSGALADPISIGLSLGAAFAETTILKLAFFAASIIYSSSEARRAKRKSEAAARAAYNASLQDRSVTSLRAIPPWRAVYGRAITGGDLRAIFTTDKLGTRTDGSTYTKPDALKHLVISFADHECQALNEVFIDGVPVVIASLDVNGWATTGEFVATEPSAMREVTIAPGGTSTQPAAVTVLQAFDTVNSVMNNDGNIYVNGTYTLTVGNTVITNTGANPIVVSFTIPVGKPSVRVTTHLGTDTQVVDSYLTGVIPTQWTANHRLRGKGYCVITLDLENQRFQGGPPNITFDVSGKKLFDPRTSTTYFSSNPALCTRDFLLGEYGYDLTSADVDDTYIIAAANACETLITLTIGADVQTNQYKYSCDGVFTTDDDKEAILSELVGTMCGQAHYGAKWLVMAGAWTAPVMDLLESDLDGAISLPQSDAGLDTLFNSVRGTFINKGAATPSDIDEYKNATWVTDDGDELWEDIALRFTNNKARARNIARIRVEQNRNGQIIKLPAKLKAWPLQIGNRVRVTSAEYGFTLKTYRVTDWQNDLNSAIELMLQEDNATIYDEADAATSDPTTNSDLPSPWVVPALTGFAATSVAAEQADGSMMLRILVSWNAVTAPYTLNGEGKVVVMYRTPGVDAVNVWQKVEVPSDNLSAFIPNMISGARVALYAYVENGLKQRSPGVSLMHTVTASTTLQVSRVFRQSSAPGAPLTSGDIWINTSENNRMYRWSGTAWVDVSTEGRLLRAIATGASDASGYTSGMYKGDDGTAIAGITSTRGYMVEVFNRATLAYETSTHFDTYASSANATSMAAHLNSIPQSKIVVVRSYDEPQNNRLAGGLPAAMYRCGASAAVFGSPQFKARGAYILVGVPGVGEGGGYEAYNGDTDNSTNAWCDVYFQIVNGQLVITGTSSTPGSLVDYGYTAPALVNAANCVYDGDTVTKIAGNSLAWDGGMYSAQSWSGGAYASCQAPSPTGATASDSVFMFGITDSIVGASYTDIAWAIYFNGSVIDLFSYGSVLVSGASTYALGDDFQVLYDGANVKFLRNGTVFYQRGLSNINLMRAKVAISNRNLPVRGLRFGAANQVPRNLIDSRVWPFGASANPLNMPGFDSNAPSATGYDAIPVAQLPDGSYANVWAAVSGTAAGTVGEGGWNGNRDLPIDSTKMYRYSVWVNAIVKAGSSYGTIYFGPWGNTVRDMGGAANSNPYFTAPSRSGLNTDEWYLLVGYVFPDGYPGADLGKGGVWHGKTGTKIVTGADFRWVVGMNYARHRAYQYYTNGAGNITHFFDPRLELCDGTEPSVQALLAMGAVSGANQITSDNAPTFVGAEGITTIVTVANNSTVGLSTSIPANGINGNGIAGGLIGPYPYATRVLVTATTTAMVTGGANGNAAKIWIAARPEPDAGFGVSDLFTSQIYRACPQLGATTDEAVAAISYEFTLAANTDCNVWLVGLNGRQVSPTGSSSLKDSLLRIEVVKR